MNIVGININEIPTELLLREVAISKLSLVVLFTSFLLVVISAKINSSAIIVSFKSLLVISKIEKLIHDNFNYDFYSNLFLFLNYSILGGYLSFMMVDECFNSKLNLFELYFLISIPILLNILFQLSMFFVNFVVNDRTLTYELRYKTKFINYLLGFLYFIMLFIIVFFEFDSSKILIFFISITLVAYSYRILTALIIGIKKKLPSYYIILYFCTLEILPILIVYKLFEGKFLV